MIRPAVLADVADLVFLGTLLARDYPLTTDQKKMTAMVNEAVASNQHFFWVSEDEETGDITGALAAVTNDNGWAKGKNSTILAWVASVRGDGLKLLREYKRWVKSRPAIKVAGMVVDVDDLEKRLRAVRILHRVGFEYRGGPNYMFT